MTSPLSHLSDNLKVTPLDNDLVEVSLTLPDDLVHDFLKVLDSLTGLATHVRSKTRLARYKDESVDILQQERIQYRDAFYKRVVALYDGYLKQGYKRTASIKLISQELRKEKHIWSSVELVRSALVAGGRPARPVWTVSMKHESLGTLVSSPISQINVGLTDPLVLNPTSPFMFTPILGT